MTKQETRSPIEAVTDALAAMTARAIKAEEERDAAARLAESWLQNWRDKEKECAELRTEVEKLRVEYMECRGELENEDALMDRFQKLACARCKYNPGNIERLHDVTYSGGEAHV